MLILLQYSGQSRSDHCGMSRHIVLIRCIRELCCFNGQGPEHDLTIFTGVVLSCCGGNDFYGKDALLVTRKSYSNGSG
jgi:hypothetical protein